MVCVRACALTQTPTHMEACARPLHARTYARKTTLSHTHTHPLSPQPTHPRARAHTRAWRIALCIRCGAGGRDPLATASRMLRYGCLALARLAFDPENQVRSRSLPRHTAVTSAPVAAARLPLGSACGGSRFGVIRCGSVWFAAAQGVPAGRRRGGRARHAHAHG
jgi:hypothetical protein